MDAPSYLVVCLNDQGKLELATRRVFDDEAEAQKYASTVNSGRNPQVVIAYGIASDIRSK